MLDAVKEQLKDFWNSPRSFLLHYEAGAAEPGMFAGIYQEFA